MGDYWDGITSDGDCFENNGDSTLPSWINSFLSWIDEIIADLLDQPGKCSVCQSVTTNKKNEICGDFSDFKT